MPVFHELSPVLIVSEMDDVVAEYETMGFRLVYPFRTGGRLIYAVIARDGAAIHLQWRAPESTEHTPASTLRIRVDDARAVLEEFTERGVLDNGHPFNEGTPYGTREFNLVAQHGTVLTFFEVIAGDDDSAQAFPTFD